MLWQLILGALLLIIGFFKLLAAGIAFSILMIILGIQFIFGFASWPFSNQCDTNSSTLAQHTWFGHGHFNLDAARLKTKQLIEYKTVFGSSEIDLAPLSPAEFPPSPIVVNIDTVFGKTVLHLNKEVPVRIFAKTALLKTILPDGTGISMGSSTYYFRPEQQPSMIIYCSTVCGKLEITAQ